MKIALVVPTVKIAYFDGTLPEPPLGLMSLAANVPDYCEVKIFDFYNNPAPNSYIVKSILEFNPDVIGFSTVFSSMYKPSLDIAKLIKDEIDVVTVMGGNHVTFMYMEAIEEKSIDFIVLHEGEIAFGNLVDYLSKKTNLFPPNNVISKDKRNTEIQLIEDLDSINPPLRDTSYFFKTNQKYRNSIITTRGCPCGCPYCSTSAMQQYKYRERSLNSVLDEIIQITTNSNDNAVTFVDDIFTYNRDRVIAFSEIIKEHNILWGCSSRINTIDEELIQIMSSSGCKGIFFGIESGSPKIMKLLNRNYAPDEVIRIFRICKDLEINAYGSFILGLPFEEEDDILKTLELAKKLPTTQLRLGPLQVYPGTKIWNNPDLFGVHVDKTIDFSSIDNDNRAHFSTNWLSKERITEFNIIGRQISQSKLNKG